MPSKPAAPFPVEFDEESLAKLNGWAKARETSVGEVIRYAIENGKLDEFRKDEPALVQFSFRLPQKDRADLKRRAKAKKVAVADLVRFAVHRLPAKPVKPKA